MCKGNLHLKDWAKVFVFTLVMFFVFDSYILTRYYVYQTTSDVFKDPLLMLMWDLRPFYQNLVKYFNIYNVIFIALWSQLLKKEPPWQTIVFTLAVYALLPLRFPITNLFYYMHPAGLNSDLMLEWNSLPYRVVFITLTIHFIIRKPMARK